MYFLMITQLKDDYMGSMIEQLFNGEIDSFENFTRTDEYDKCSSEIIKKENEFLNIKLAKSKDKYMINYWI